MSSRVYKFILGFLLTLLIMSGEIFMAWPDEKTHLVFCDVGQGDAILLYRGFTQVLIDMGPDQKSRECLDKYLPFFDKNLELLVVTHADQDHIGGAQDIFNGFLIEKVLLSEDGKNTDAFTAFNNLISREKEDGMQQLSADGVKNFCFTDFFCAQNLISEPELWDEEASSNNQSVVLLLDVGGIKVLLTGDMESQREQAISASFLIGKVNILKVSHHGSKSSSSEEFLRSISPEISVISVGQNNQFGHPHAVTLENLQEVGSQIYRTDQMGDAHLLIDEGSFYMVE